MLLLQLLEISITISELFRLDLVLNVRKRDLSPTALHSIALETINTRFPPEEWLHIYTDGSLLDFAQCAGIGVFSHLFTFYLHAGPLTTHFDASRAARDKPWSTLYKKSHGIPSSPRAAAVAKFRLLTGHDCLWAHLFRFNLVTSPICVLCDTGQDMTAAHLDECSALNDLNCIVKSDEAHFWLNGYANKQNCRIWSEANPQVYVKTSLHPEKLTVWCALWAGGILLQKQWPERYNHW
ncbi:uncharacterized protein TNCV_3685351 [Trichonephila clavipes]|nr:uncharacterized protein TNCV_3685351 [Trichonephila clavipes]